jgi:hypothetical protein
VYWRGLAKTSEKFDIPTSIWRMAFIKYFPIRVGLGIRPTAGIGTVRAVKQKLLQLPIESFFIHFVVEGVFIARLGRRRG